MGDRIHVVPLNPRHSDILELTEKAKMDLQLSQPRLWRVLAVGPGRTLKNGQTQDMEMDVGDRVVTHSYTEGPFDLPDGTSIISASQVLAVFPKAT